MGSRRSPRRQTLLADSRYELLVKIATGGQATVYVGRARGSEGFRRLVAIKRAHPHLREDPKARSMLIREARLASRIHHANVVPIVDVDESDDELLLVMDYIEGGALSDLLEREVSAGAHLPRAIALPILLDACAGLGAVHALASEEGKPLGLVHRDVSPQNILVGVDGAARLTDFGLAQLTEVTASASATVRGKLPYLAPETIDGARFTQRCDVFSMGVVVWETLAGRRLFLGSNDANTLRRVMREPAPPLSEVVDGLGTRFDEVVARALHKQADDRYESIHDLARALAAAAEEGDGRASRDQVSQYVRDALATELAHRRNVIAATTDPDQAVTAGEMKLDELPIELPPLPTSVAAVAPPGADEQEGPTTRMRARQLTDDPAIASETDDLDGPTRPRLEPIAAAPAPPDGTVPELAAPPPARRGWLVPAGLALLGLATFGLVVTNLMMGTGAAPVPSKSESSARPAAPPASTTAPTPARPTGAGPGSASAASAPSAAATPRASTDQSARPRRPRPPTPPRPTTTAPALPDNPYKHRQGG